MISRQGFRIAAVLIIGCAAIPVTFFFTRPIEVKTSIPAAVKEEVTVGWRKGFSFSERGALPEGWKLAKKPGTKPATFLVETDPEKNAPFLRMTADKASASLVTSVDSVNLARTPVLRWRWRANTLPEGADGRTKGKDDQAIGIYVGEGSALNNKSISYRWDTETPKGAQGDSAYGPGGIKVKWYTLRNKTDAADGQWYVEERNVAEDFKEAWGHYPEKIYLSVSCNSQYTRSSAAADLGWVEFVSVTPE